MARIDCPYCGQKMREVSRYKKSAEVAKNYAECVTPECSHFGRRFSAYISIDRCMPASVQSVQATFDLLLGGLPPADRAELINNLQSRQ